MKKLTLDFDNTFQWETIGISCQLADYKFVFNINKYLKSTFKRVENFRPSDAKTKEGFSLYVYTDEENMLSFYLLSNKRGNEVLVNEFKQLDYFLVVEGEPSADFLKKTTKLLREIPGVLFTQLIEISAVKKYSRLSEDLELHLNSQGII